MSENTKELNDLSFDDFISKGNCIIDFWAEWCGPCKVLKPIFEEIALELNGKFKFGKLNIEHGQETSDKLGVMSIPTVIFFKDGEIVDRFSGVVEKKEFLKMIKNAF